MVTSTLRSVLPLALLSVLALPGCPNNDPPGVYSIADWRLGCDSVMTGCTPALARAVTGFNGEMGNTVSCSVTERGADRVVSFRTGSLTEGVAYSISLTSATVPRAGGLSRDGQITVVEGANTYRGLAGSATPTALQPCQLRVMFGTDAATGSTLLEAELLCDHLPNNTDPSSLRGISAGAGSSEPATLNFFDCRGLTHE
jgi:hypothetical protein